jgi:hypothetical protein
MNILQRALEIKGNPNTGVDVDAGYLREGEAERRGRHGRRGGGRRDSLREVEGGTTSDEEAAAPSET